VFRAFSPKPGEEFEGRNDQHLKNLLVLRMVAGISDARLQYARLLQSHPKHVHEVIL
jgi:hypothetical protein